MTWAWAMQQQAFPLRAVPVMLRPGECRPSMLAELLQASSAAGYTKLMLRLLESYPVAAQQLSAEQLERLLLQSFAWHSSGNCDGDADDERQRVFRVLWQLPAVSAMSAGAVTHLAAALISAGQVPMVEGLLSVPAARSLSVADIFATAEAFVEYPYKLDSSALHALMQLPSAREITAEQVGQLLVAAIQQQQHVMLELLQSHPAAPRVGATNGCPHGL